MTETSKVKTKVVKVAKAATWATRAVARVARVVNKAAVQAARVASKEPARPVVAAKVVVWAALKSKALAAVARAVRMADTKAVRKAATAKIAAMYFLEIRPASTPDVFFLRLFFENFQRTNNNQICHLSAILRSMLAQRFLYSPPVYALPCTVYEIP